jgi:hypothetical protein
MNTYHYYSESWLLTLRSKKLSVCEEIQHLPHPKMQTTPSCGITTFSNPNTCII